MDEYQCECGKGYKTAGGLYKHQKNYEHGKFAPVKSELEQLVDDQLEIEESEVENQETESETVSNPEENNSGISDWKRHTPQSDSEETVVTDQVPTFIKLSTKTLGKKGKKLDAELQKSIDKSILKAVYSGSDMVMTQIAKSVTDGKVSEIKHSDADKEFTATITVEALHDNDIVLSEKIGLTQIALAANAFYFGSPAVRIYRNQEKSLLKRGGKGIFRRLWPFGRKKKVAAQNEVAQRIQDAAAQQEEMGIYGL